jgi:hypothetical protein
MSNTNTEQWGNIELPGLSDEKLYGKNWNFSRKGNKTYHAAMTNLHKDPSFVEKRISAIKNRSEEDRKLTGKKITEARHTMSQAQADEIWMKLWGPDRGNELYKQLAKEYGVSVGAVKHLANGKQGRCPVSKEQYKLILDHWNKLYGYQSKVYIVRSPGNDLLDFYDQQHAKRPDNVRGILSPSEVFNIRFRWKDKTAKAVKSYCDSKGIVISDSSKSLYRDYINKKLDWLIDEPHKEWRFNSLHNLKSCNEAKDKNKKLIHFILHFQF